MGYVNSYNYESGPVTYTFDDSASSNMECYGNNPTGTYKPTACNGSEANNFPLLAPQTAPYAVSLGVFNGTNPNGNWNLYVVDDFSQDEGTINNGWSLTIHTDPSCATPTPTPTPTPMPDDLSDLFKAIFNKYC